MRNSWLNAAYAVFGNVYATLVMGVALAITIFQGSALTPLILFAFIPMAGNTLKQMLDARRHAREDQAAKVAAKAQPAPGRA